MICTVCILDKTEEDFHKGKSQCKECRKVKSKIYYDANSEKNRAASKSWRESHIDEARKYNVTWRAENSEKASGIKKDWYEANAEKVKARVRAYRRDNPEKVREAIRSWSERNPEKVRAYARNRRALKSGASADLTVEQEKELWGEGICFYCEEIAVGLDHIVPLSPRNGILKGHHTAGNVVTACAPCNCSKNNLDPLVWYFRERWQGSEVYPVSYGKEG